MKKTGWFILLVLMCPPSFSAEEAHWLDEYREEVQLFDRHGYRITRYRSPTPENSDDAELLTTEELEQWLRGGDKPLLLDVLPLQTFDGEFIQSEPRFNIPGSMWLPNVGRGELDRDQTSYFREGMLKLTGGDFDCPVVIYCRADCWMSWNAVKRAKSWGYTRLYWYRDGMSGWREAGLDQRESSPEPLKGRESDYK